MIIALQCIVHDPYLHLLIVVVVVVCDHQLSSGGAVVGGWVENHQVGQLLLPPLVSVQDVQVLPPLVNVALVQTLPGDRVPLMLMVLPSVVMHLCQTLLAVHHLDNLCSITQSCKLSDEFETRRSSHDAAVHPPALSCAQLSDLVAAKQLLLTR